MPEIVMRIECEKPELVMKSLVPDIENGDEATTQITVEGGCVVISVKARKLNRMKALMNTYISLVQLLCDAQEGLFKGKA